MPRRDLEQRRDAASAGFAHERASAREPALVGQADGARDLAGELARAYDPDGIESVVVWVSERAADLIARPPLPSPLAGRFSIPFVTATTLAHGRADIPAFERAALEDPRICALADRVELRVDPEYGEVFPRLHRGRVEIRTADGRVLAGSCENPYGNAEHPASEEHVRLKFEQLVGEALSPEAAGELWTRIRGIDHLDRIGDLFDGFTAARAPK